MTFSVIIPVYNAEKYLAKCLDSILAQSFSDFEIILVNDGSPDNSQEIIDRYVAIYPQKVRFFLKENGGAADARNYGIEKASGKYLVFIDSDDHVHPEMFSQLQAEIDAYAPDVIGFHLSIVNSDNQFSHLLPKPIMHGCSGEKAIINLVSSKQDFDAVCGYTFRTEYWKSNRFSFAAGIYQEDFGLIPFAVLHADTVSCIDFAPYYYVQTENSVMRNQAPEKIRKRINDLLTAYDSLMSLYHTASIKNTYAEKMFLAYAANAVIYRMNSVEPDIKEWYRAELIRRNVSQYLISDTWKRKVRKLLIRLKYRI